jgi:hypothetical protein
VKPTRCDTARHRPGDATTATPGRPGIRQHRPRPAASTVNDGLTPKRRQPVTENSEYAVFARRVLRAYSRRVAVGDVESLTDLISLADDIDEAIGQAMHGLRDAGYSWAEISSRLGTTRQQRWGRPGTTSQQ